MFENVDLTKQLDKEAFRKVLPELQDRLRDLARQVYDAGIPVIIVFEGWDAAGKGTNINRLVERLDPRGFKVHPVSAPLEDERLRPFLWRFWNKIPARGQIAIFDRSWYGRVLVERMDKLCAKAEWQAAYHEIRDFERQLADDGTVVVKFWLHISKKEQRRRFEKCEADPFLRWKIEKEDWKHHREYKKYYRAVEEMFEKTSTAQAPWTIVEAEDRRFATVKILQTVCDAMADALKAKKTDPAKPAVAPAKAPARVRPAIRVATILDKVDLSKKLDKDQYSTRLKKLQVRLRELEFEMYHRRLPVIVLYEGWDAAGKGGNIKRLTQTLDPRGYSVIPIAAPTGDEKTHHYLWRFWRQIPKAGHLAIFDRTWYGRVLVERVEGFCSEAEWKRAYHEINEFEGQLASFGTVLCKFWLQISKEEQLRRFKERETVAYKHYKLTDEDWRNREKWSRYEPAVVDMLEKTSTTYAPWTIVEANCKWYARVKTLATLVQAIERGLKQGHGRADK
ncbi:MAG: phosphate--AMP phosphotransferase [Verrucomicrobia bacterium]|nr:phosphate--AMP phosphotransferase [Verrucomicrobiota bacterium]